MGPGHGHGHGHGHGPPGRPGPKVPNIFVQTAKGGFVRTKTQQIKTKTKKAPGLGGIDRARRGAFNAPNESSVAALGASLVTKQAGRVPQDD